MCACLDGFADLDVGMRASPATAANQTLLATAVGSVSARRERGAGCSRAIRSALRPRSAWVLGLCAMAALEPAMNLTASAFVTNTYSILAEDIPNPERGFYRHEETFASRHKPLTNDLATARLVGWPASDRAYSARVTLVLRLFYLDDFVASSISEGFLEAIEADFNLVRDQGLKAIVRFAYHRDETPPFDEPSRDRILAHIAQLRPLLRRHADVIAVLQQGFIGAYGEGYYTHQFSVEPGHNTAENWVDRANVIAALLEALPPDRMVQVRHPQQRQKHLFGAGAPTNVPIMSASDAHHGSAAARLGIHNDCFLADARDAGTFATYDEAPGSPEDLPRLRAYLAGESRFVVVGGETCVPNSPEDGCTAAGGRADFDLELFHYSFLNLDYNTEVNAAWVGQGCFEEIRRRLGYRLSLVAGEFPLEVRAGESCSLRLILQNTGYAAPFNPRGLELILRHTATQRLYYAELSRDVDPRFWWPGTNIAVAARLALPVTMPTGVYELLLHLPDPAPTLYGRPEYSIHLANSHPLTPSGPWPDGVWEDMTGFHRLGHLIAVNDGVPPRPLDGTEVPVLEYSAVRERYDTWRERHFSGMPGDGAPERDPDGDGWANLAEYAVGSDPQLAALNHVQVTVEDGIVTLRLDKPPGLKDVDFALEASTDLALGSWSSSHVTVVENTVRRLVARFDSTGPVGFLRLRFTLR